MEKTIEKYVYAVVKRLPAEKRDEVSKELESNIYDLLGSDTTDEKLDQVLHDLGHPMIVASKYRNEPDYVVNPVHYQDYKNILIIAMIGSSILGLVVALINGFVNPEVHDNLGDLISFFVDGIVDNMIGYSCFAFTLVTVIFWYLNSKSGRPKIDNYLKNWKTKDLNAVPKDGKKEKHSNRITIFIEAIFSLLIQAFFITAFMVYYENMAIYLNGTKSAQIFSDSIKTLLVATGFTGLGFSAVYYISYITAGKKSFTVVSLRTLDTLVNIIFMMIILTRNDLFSADFIAYMADLFKVSIDVFTSNLKHVLTALMVIILLANGAETYVNWHSYRKNK